MKSNLHLDWCRLFARGLAGSGVRDVVISPGSRSTPMVLGLDAEPSLRKHLVIDERSAAFFALGQARATGQPTALLCTSGTAAAHYAPAVAEASLAHVPLIVISADRPWEAYDCAASQTMDQVKLFGDHVRHQAELGLPDSAALPAVLRVAAQSSLRARWPIPGPVHVNARFRKPLEPVDAPQPEPHSALLERLLQAGPPALFPPREVPDPAGVSALVQAVRSCRRGLWVAGPSLRGDVPGLSESLRDLARLLGYPVLAETTSQLRGMARDIPVISSFDALFRCPSFLQQHPPELILELGLPPVSTAYGAWLAAHPRVQRIVLAPHGWSDPHGTASMLLWGDPAETLQAVLHHLSEPPSLDLSWPSAWQHAAAEVDALAERELAREHLSEGAVARCLLRALDENTTILIGNSGPVRDVDLYGTSTKSKILHQRGAAGIDGLIAGAAGVASVAEGKPVVVFLGDISLTHDLGSLGLAARSRGPLVIVVTNNDGGRIFEQLPLARRGEVRDAFERYFLTSHGGNFEAPARAFGLRYSAVAARPALDEALREALSFRGATLIEAQVPPEDGARQRTALWQALAERLKER